MKEAVRSRYAQHARQLPDEETPPTLGVGDPVSLAELQPGETVLDLGSGPGRDLLAAARAVGSQGRAIGVDMTPEMVTRARAAAAAAGLGNVSVLDGDLEGLPIHCGAVDAVVSNCVINLVGDKRRALVEAYRALRPGGRLAIVDTAFATEPGAEVRSDPDAWSCCVGGALVASDYRSLLHEIGYENVRLSWLDATCGASCETGEVQAGSVAVTARKPGDAAPDIRPAVAADREAIEDLLHADGLPTAGLRTEDAIVALDSSTVVGAAALERYGHSSMLRSLVVDPPHRHRGLGQRLTIAALEVARWSGSDDVYLLTEGAADFFERFGFVAASMEEAERACPRSALMNSGCCGEAAALRLRFEDADLPLLGRPSHKRLPTFQDDACC